MFFERVSTRRKFRARICRKRFIVPEIKFFSLYRELREIKHPLGRRISPRHICSIIAILVHHRVNAAILTIGERRWIDNRFQQLRPFLPPFFHDNKNSYVTVPFNMYLEIVNSNGQGKKRKITERGGQLVSFLINRQQFCKVKNQSTRSN